MPKIELSPLEKLLIIPANSMKRYKYLPIEQKTHSRIFGKLKKHSIEQYVEAGNVSYPKAKTKTLFFKEGTTSSEDEMKSMVHDDLGQNQSSSPVANYILNKYRH